MQLHHVLLVAAIAVQLSSAFQTASKTSKLNGWFACSESVFDESGSSDVQGAECATYSAPLCYPGVCKAPESVNQTVDIFVKRLPADEPKTATNVWLLRGQASADQKSKTCSKYKFGNYDAPGIIYKHDKYWNARIAIPDQASVLLVSSKMDTQTPHKYAESFLKSLKGDNKELITFDYSVHGALTSILLETEVPEIETCGVELLASYVSSGGDLDSLDKSCLDEMLEFNLTLNDFHKIMLGGVDAYDGTFELIPGRY
ncbi:hypothetical protein PC111_g23607 [Phytophthora cactorum]|nr:hypothetical protein PC111_g23607 [Phytophthora cactorum]